MTHVLDQRPLPDGWIDVTPREARRLLAQLWREQPRQSILSTLNDLRVVARAGGSDDILCRADAVIPVFFVAHLTWGPPAERTDDNLYPVETVQDLIDTIGPLD